MGGMKYCLSESNVVFSSPKIVYNEINNFSRKSYKIEKVNVCIRRVVIPGKCLINSVKY